jgi:salicylate hydroxylase
MVRRPRSQRVVTSSKENADLLCLCYEGVEDNEEKLKKAWGERYQWLWGIDVEKQVEDARRTMITLMQKELETTP